MWASLICYHTHALKEAYDLLSPHPVSDHNDGIHPWGNSQLVGQDLELCLSFILNLSGSTIESRIRPVSDPHSYKSKYMLPQCVSFYPVWCVFKDTMSQQINFDTLCLVSSYCFLACLSDVCYREVRCIPPRFRVLFNYTLQSQAFNGLSDYVNSQYQVMLFIKNFGNSPNMAWPEFICQLWCSVSHLLKCLTSWALEAEPAYWGPLARTDSRAKAPGANKSLGKTVLNLPPNACKMDRTVDAQIGLNMCQYSTVLSLRQPIFC